MAANPSPTRISNEMWRFWEEFLAFEKSAKLGGIYANKPGYHNYGSALPGSDYSVRDVPNDRQGPADKASAWDLTLPPAEMKLYTKRLVDACKRKDPRLFKDGQPIIREVIGTLDGKTVYCWVLVGGGPLGVKGDSGSDPGRDKSHLWHIHISLIRRFINDWSAIAGILSILKGEPISGVSTMFCKKGDKGTDAVETLQRMLADMGYYTGKIDRDFGAKTSSALLACRKAMGSVVETGDWYTPAAYTQVHRAYAIWAAGPGTEGPRGPQGIQGVKGDKGDPGEYTPAEVVRLIAEHLGKAA